MLNDTNLYCIKAIIKKTYLFIILILTFFLLTACTEKIDFVGTYSGYEMQYYTRSSNKYDTSGDNHYRNVYITLYEDGTYALTWNDINGIRTGDYIYEGGILYVDYYEFTVDRSNDTLFLSHESEYEYMSGSFQIMYAELQKD